MTVTLDHLLQLVGTLDDAPGFDTPRARYRRFLVERAGDLPLLRTLVDQAQHAPGDQHRRAIEDLIAVLGRTMDVDTVFAGTSEPGRPTSSYGAWRCGGRTVVLALQRTAMDDSDAADLRRWMATAAGTRIGREMVGLLVAGPLTPARDAFVAALAAARAHGEPAVAVVSLRGLLTAVELVHAHRLTTTELVRLIDAHTSLDFVIELLARMAGTTPDAAPAGVEALAGVEAPAGVEPRTFRSGVSSGDTPAEIADSTAAIDPTVRGAPTAPAAPPRGWVAAVAPDHATGPEQFLELVVARRRLFGINDVGTFGPPARRGDLLAFYLAGRGLVGSARIGAIVQGGSGLRNADRYRHLLHLEDVVLHLDRPVPLDPETQLRLRTAPTAANRHVHTLVAMSADLLGDLLDETPRRTDDAIDDSTISAADSH